MTKREIIEHCLTYEDCYEDYPFGEDSWTVMRHKSNNKSFAMVFIWNDRLCLNVKCEPMQAEFLRTAVEGVIPAYHMNKKHWNTVFVDTVNTDELLNMIYDSFIITQNCTKNKAKKN